MKNVPYAHVMGILMYVMTSIKHDICYAWIDKYVSNSIQLEYIVKQGSKYCDICMASRYEIVYWAK
jgi:hypothetical protein